MSWTEYSSAPPPGTPVCPRSAVRGATILTLQTERGAFPLLVVETPVGLRGYVNACPHQYLPLDYRSSQILSADGRMLLCSAHGARFDAVSGTGVGGEGLGCALDAVPLRALDGHIFIGDGSGA